MPIAIGIEGIIKSRTVESAKIEYKEGWNPAAILHTVCAFANDIDNWGGGYIVVGVAEKNGRPVIPPAGLNPESVDDIQKELLSLCKRITPAIMPMCEPVMFEG